VCAVVSVGTGHGMAWEGGHCVRRGRSRPPAQHLAACVTACHVKRTHAAATPRTASAGSTSCVTTDGGGGDGGGGGGCGCGGGGGWMGGGGEGGAGGTGGVDGGGSGEHSTLTHRSHTPCARRCTAFAIL
jgi:hypothetical protein